MSDRTKALLGIATFGQIPTILFLLLTDADPPMSLLFVLVLLQFGLWVFYLSDIRQNSRVPPAKERAWRWAILMLGPLAEPIYFWRFIKGEDPV